MKQVTIIGGGNLGSAIACGMLESGFVSAGHLTITKRNTATLAPLAAKGVQITCNNQQAIAGADVIILCVKPYQVAVLLTQLAFTPGQLLISAVSGVTIGELHQYLPASVRVCRAMPNTAIAIRESMTCLCFDADSAIQAAYVQDLFDRLGSTIVIDESLMNAATVLAACGTAFAMRYIRAQMQAGVEIGFTGKDAFMIATQTVKGAAALLIQSGNHPEQEIDKVTTPGGCTIAGLNEMEHRGFSAAAIKGVVAGYERLK